MQGFFGAETAGYWPWAYIMGIITAAVAYGVRMYYNRVEQTEK